MFWPVHGQRVDEREVCVDRMAVFSMFCAPRVSWKEQGVWDIRCIFPVSEGPGGLDFGLRSDVGEHG